MLNLGCCAVTARHVGLSHPTHITQRGLILMPPTADRNVWQTRRRGACPHRPVLLFLYECPAPQTTSRFRSLSAATRCRSRRTRVTPATAGCTCATASPPRASRRPTAASAARASTTTGRTACSRTTARAATSWASPGSQVRELLQGTQRLNPNQLAILGLVFNDLRGLRHTCIVKDFFFIQHCSPNWWHRFAIKFQE